VYKYYIRVYFILMKKCFKTQSKTMLDYYSKLKIVSYLPINTISIYKSYECYDCRQYYNSSFTCSMHWCIEPNCDNYR
jgi:hypothetical protein